MTGLRTNWNGVVDLVPDAHFKGKKPFSCAILLAADLASQNVRWRTLIHECLHAFSAGYNPLDFENYPGWEEGVVEQLQRLLRPTLLLEMGLDIDSSVFEEVERTHLYNRYILALESVRLVLERDTMDFYLGLLRTPMRDRYSTLLQQGSGLEPDKRKGYIMALSVCKVVLERRL